MTNTIVKEPNNNNEEKVNMKKYIVEVPEPQEGQEVSTGGIRENGKIVSLFKNPVPWESSTKTMENSAMPSELLENIREGSGISTSQSLVPNIIPEKTTPILPYSPSVDLVHNEQVAKYKDEAVRYLLGLFWHEFGEPLLRSLLHKGVDMVINKIDSSSKYNKQGTPHNSEIIDIGADDFKIIHENTQTIDFPNEKVS